MTTRVAIAGATGRMGRMLLEALSESECTLAAALERADSPHIGKDAQAFGYREQGILLRPDLAAALAASEVLIDFTRPEGTLAHLAACRAAKKPIVIGTTGFDDAGKTAIAMAAKDISVVFAPNMSVGVNITLKLIEQAARALDADYDIEIVEMHHNQKVDAPSGTALKMGEVAAAARGTSLAAEGVLSREGHTGARKRGAIGFATLRGGDVIGDHTVIFAGGGERIEISHKSSTRGNYAKGAIKAARWLAGKPPGLYDMQDVLGLK
ncbi:MAG: 4-hydroxy-tetrahydrodipicolinate reductase [Betaproteobacteria bacterium]|nr:4-hydroxy-tetrahydrodipicolinate reductase [Betaproteobacteria bacterium]